MVENLGVLRLWFLLISLGIPLAVVIFAIILRYQKGETYTSGADLLLAGAVFDFSAVAVYDQLSFILSSPFKELGVPLFIISGILKLCYLLDCIKVERRLTLNFIRRILGESGALGIAPSEIQVARFPLVPLFRTWLVSTTLVGLDLYMIVYRGS